MSTPENVTHNQLVEARRQVTERDRTIDALNTQLTTQNQDLAVIRAQLERIIDTKGLNTTYFNKAYAASGLPAGNTFSSLLELDARLTNQQRITILLDLIP